MNSGSVRSGYHFISFIAAEKASSRTTPSPHSAIDAANRDEADGGEHALTGESASASC